MRKQDLAGLKFGRLFVLRRVGSNSRGISTWLCSCECGGEKVVDADCLKRGSTASCGCLALEQRKEAAQRKCHDLSRSKKPKERMAWESMLRRCYDPKHPSFNRYSTRGIVVCDSWRESFAAFYADMGDAPKGTTLDRIDNNLGYSKENCRWADMTVQGNNRGNNISITFAGKTMNLSQWARETGIRPNTLHRRLTSGWSVERMLTQPPSKKIQVRAHGESQYAAQRKP